MVRGLGQPEVRVWELRVVARLAELIERQTPSDPYLAHLVGRIAADGVLASQHIFRLVRLVNWLESRRNRMCAIVAYALLLPEQLSFAIEALRTLGVHKGIAGILAENHGDPQLESACLREQSGDECCRRRSNSSSR